MFIALNCGICKKLEETKHHTSNQESANYGLWAKSNQSQRVGKRDTLVIMSILNILN